MSENDYKLSTYQKADFFRNVISLNLSGHCFRETKQNLKNDFKYDVLKYYK